MIGMASNPCAFSHIPWCTPPLVSLACPMLVSAFAATIYEPNKCARCVIYVVRAVLKIHVFHVDVKSAVGVLKAKNAKLKHAKLAKTAKRKSAKTATTANAKNTIMNVAVLVCFNFVMSKVAILKNWLLMKKWRVSSCVKVDRKWNSMLLVLPVSQNN